MLRLVLCDIEDHVISKLNHYSFETLLVYLLFTENFVKV